jgi:hypothetical protein
MKNIIVIVSLLLCLAGSASAQEHFLEIIKAEQNQKSIARGVTIPGMMVNEDKDVKVGRKLNVGDRVSVPKDVRVTFESSNTNKIETINNTEFIVSNITDKGEAYYQLFGKIRYIVIPKAMEFFNVYHTKYCVAVEGTIFEVDIDLEKKEIEFTAEEGNVFIIREYNIKVGDKEIRQKERNKIYSRNEKLQQLKYGLKFDEKKFKNYKEAVSADIKDKEDKEKDIDCKSISQTVNFAYKRLYERSRVMYIEEEQRVLKEKQKYKADLLYLQGALETYQKYLEKNNSDVSFKKKIKKFKEEIEVILRRLEKKDG